MKFPLTRYYCMSKECDCGSIEYIDTKAQVFTVRKCNQCHERYMIPINDILEKYEKEAKEKFLLEVYNLYFENVLDEYQSYSTFDEELIIEIFDSSTFSSLINEDLHYVLDKYPEYWAMHIIKEVNNTVDFDELRKAEIELHDSSCM